MKQSTCMENLKVTLIDLSKEIYVPILPDEQLLLEQSIFDNFQYSRKRHAYQKRAKFFGNHSEGEWMQMVEFFNHRCCRCFCDVIGIPCKDHIISIRIGGTSSIRNLQPLCRHCNSSKGLDKIDYRRNIPTKWQLQLHGRMD